MIIKNKIVIDSQIKWEAAKVFFTSSSNYRLFSKHFWFASQLMIKRTIIDISDALPRSEIGGKRWNIFSNILKDNNSVAQINEEVKIYGGEADADIFIGLYKNYIKLETDNK